MPTAYTAPIYENEEISFAQFVWRCARNCGAMVTLRDEPMDTPIPERFYPSEFYATAEREAKGRLDYLLSLRASDVEKDARTDYEHRLERWGQRRAENASLAARYHTMIAAVEAWEPPTPDHKDFQDFMRDQLIRSIEGDCHVWPRPEPVGPNEWYSEALEAARNDLQRAEIGLWKEKERVHLRNEWIASLRESVPPP